jgi:tetratricopeptide (TPR) repeat protein
MRYLSAGLCCLFLVLPGRAVAVSLGKPVEKMPLTGLAPARLVPDLCLVHYRVTTTSPECQAFFDQGLGYQYSYVWMEAARSFETALRHDPSCALAWWGLSRALADWHRGDANKALAKANELKGSASRREQLLIEARTQERGLVDGLSGIEPRYQAAIRTIDSLLALHDDDQEAWFYRGLLAGRGALFGANPAALPFYKALLRINPLHPGANHELVHIYENIQRPALGWVYAENYIKSSPGIPHPFHMQAHLATRLGRWDKTSDRSSRAVVLQRAYHKALNVKPSEDHQFSHHLEILTLSLIHDGRLREARALKDEVWGYGYRHWLPWFKLHLAECDWTEALKIVDHFRKSDKVTAAYLSALVYLKRGDPERALPEVQVLQEAYRQRKDDGLLQFRLWETQGLYLCQTGDPDGGLKLLARAVDRSKNDYGHHSWGNGAYYMEEWGTAALKCGKNDVAEEGFLEALAHDPGSVHGALGLQVLCQRQGRTEEATRYAALAHRSWRHAEVGTFDRELLAMQEIHAPPSARRAQSEKHHQPGKRGEGGQ